MADPLSISASIAGLITIADIVVTRGYKFILAVRDADKAVANLINETNLLSGTLYSLRHIAQGLERGNTAFVSTTRVEYVEACYQTLKEIQKILAKFELSTSTKSVQLVKSRLKWPLVQSETKGLLEQVRRHREVLSLALNADELSALIQLLSRQNTIGDDLSAVKKGLEEDRLQRKEVTMNEERLRMLDWLCPPAVDPELNQKSALDIRHANTGMWFLDGNEFQEWKLGDNSALWIHGIPGAGKTILMSTIIQELEKQIRLDEGLAYYYCDYKDTNTYQASFILGAIIKQFVLQKEEAIQELAIFYKTHRQATGRYRSPDLKSLLEQLHNIMELFSATTVIIDGLDEISGKRWDTLDLLQRIRRENSTTRTIYASRKETDIEACLHGYKEVSIVAQCSDLELYVASEIQERTRKRQLSISNSDLKETIMHRLINEADGMFRWVACQIDHLCELPNDKARSTALDDLPRGLPETYERILHRVLERHRDIHTFVARALQWLAFSNGTLAGDALLAAISVNPGDSILDYTTIPTENDLLKWCSSLIRRRETEDGVEFAHFTVKEYLLSISTAGACGLSFFALSKNEADLTIGQTCLTYLLLDEFSKAPPSDEIFDHQEEEKDANPAKELFRKSLDKYPFYIHAALNWEAYIQKHLKNHEIIQLTHKLFHPEKSNQFLWFCYTIMSAACKPVWVDACPDTTTLHWAALFSLEEVCSWLIKQGCDVNRRSLVGTPLNCALQGLSALNRTHYNVDEEMMQESRSRTARRIIEAGASIDDSNTFDPHSVSPPLVVALHSRCCDKILLKQLCKGGNAVEEFTLGAIGDMLRDDDSALPCLEAFFSVVSYHKVPRNSQARFLEFSNRVSTTALVLSKKIDAEKENMTPKDRLRTLEALFEQASAHGMKHELASLLASISHLVNKEEISQILAKGLTLVLEGGHENCLETIFLCGADPNIPNEHGRMALHVALDEANTLDDNVVIRNVKRLLEHDADFSAPSKSGELPLQVAASNSTHKQLLRELCLIVGTANFQLLLSRHNPSLLSCAMQSGSDDNVRFLLEKHEIVNLDAHVCETGDTLLGLAAFRETSLAMDLLLKRELSINTLNANGSSILYNASVSEYKEVFDYLVAFGAIDNSSRPSGRKAIHEVASSGSDEANEKIEYKYEIEESEEPILTAKLAALLLAGEDPNAQTADGSSALHFTGHSILRTQLLCKEQQIRVNLKNNNGLTPLMVYSGGLGNCLLKPPGKSNSDRGGRKNLISNIISNIKLLLSQKADASLVDNSGRTALHHLFKFKWSALELVQEDFFDTLQAIVSSGGKMAAKSHLGESPFEQLIKVCVETDRREDLRHTWLKKHLELVLNFVLSNVPGEVPNELSTSGITPLAFTIGQFGMRIAGILLTRQELDVDKRDQLKRITAVEIAAQMGCTEVIARSLLSRTRTPLHTLNIHGSSLLHYSVQEKKNQTMLKLLLEKKVGNLQIPTRDGQTPLELAILSENPAAVKLLVEAGVNINMPFSKSTLSPLHSASFVGSLAIVSILAGHGADINAQLPTSKATPLHFASSSQKAQWDVSSYLIDKGADVYALDHAGLTPYLAAAVARRWDIIEGYMKTDTNLDKKDKNGYGLIDWAITHDQNTIMQILQHGMDLKHEIRDEEDKLVSNSLLVAVECNNEAAFEILWDDFIINFTTDNGWTLAHFAITPSKNEVRNRLLLHDISWNASTATPRISGMFLGEMATLKGLNPLHIAAWGGAHPEGGNDSAITFLFKNKLLADVDALTLSVHRYSALHLATIFNRLSTVKLLHSYGVDLELVDGVDHQAALHHAAKRGLHQIVIALLEAGCKPNEPDIHGMTPELLAIESGCQSVVKILGQHLDALEAMQELSGINSSGFVKSHSSSAEEENFKSSSTNPPVNPISTNALSTIPKKPWRLPLHQGSNMRKIMTEDVSIYAINEKDCPKELRKMLEEHEGKHVDSLGKPYRRRI